MATGIAYNEQMCLHEEHNHPEQPDRIRCIYENIQKENLLDKCKIIQTRNATDTEILYVHDNYHLEKMRLIPEMNQLELFRLSYNYNSVYFNKDTYDCALLSAGSVIEICDKVVLGELANGIAIVRPPGHHAEEHMAMGFCIFNNVAVAAKTMIKQHKLKRIVILDWDVHHGNATQHIFDHNPQVLYISIHRYDNASFYPGSKDADPSCVGIGPGIGYNINIAWNTQFGDTIGDDEYIYAFNALIQPILTEYNPELIIVSAGFDCARNDPLGGLDVTPNGFYYMTSELMKFANGRIVCALEGGYNLTAISESMTACLKALLREPCVTNLKNNKDICRSALTAVASTIKYHKPYWKCLA